MNKTGRRLGRGLDALVSPIHREPTTDFGQVGAKPQPSADSVHQPLSMTSRAAMLLASDLSPNPFQPRLNFSNDDVLSLAKSIQTSGFVQPIAVRQVGNGYQIIAGERRWRAAKSLNMREVPVLIRTATDEQMLELALVENIQREDLNPIDRARAYREFCDRFGLSADQVGERLNEDRTTVVNYLRLLDLPEPIRELVTKRKLSMGHARCLLGIQDPVRQRSLADASVRNELSVRALEELVRRERTSPDAGSPPTTASTNSTSLRVRSAHLKDMERRFEQAVKTRVSIQEGKRRGTGRIVIEYYSLADFERLASALGVALD